MCENGKLETILFRFCEEWKKVGNYKAQNFPHFIATAFSIRIYLQIHLNAKRFWGIFFLLPF